MVLEMKYNLYQKITPDQAYSEIKKLVSEGKIYKYCGGKYTKYKLR